MKFGYNPVPFRKWLLKGFTIYREGSHTDQVIWTVFREDV